jgi:hypothetical protein
VLSGRLTIQMRDGDVVLGPGEMYVVPKGVEHCPRADEETHLLIIEPAGTPNTGDPETAVIKIQDLTKDQAMLLIHCPYCQEERPELEFRNARARRISNGRKTSPNQR